MCVCPHIYVLFAHLCEYVCMCIHWHVYVCAGMHFICIYVLMVYVWICVGIYVVHACMGTIWEGMGSMALLEKVCHWGWALRFQKPMLGLVIHSLCLQLLDYICAFCYCLSTMPACLPAYHSIPSHDHHELTLWNSKQAPTKCFLL